MNPPKPLPPAQHISELAPEQLKRLASLMRPQTSYGSLRQYARGSNPRRFSAEMAIHVEKGGLRMGLYLPREMHANGCEVCEFAKFCRQQIDKMK